MASLEVEALALVFLCARCKPSWKVSFQKVSSSNKTYSFFQKLSKNIKNSQTPFLTQKTSHLPKLENPPQVSSTGMASAPAAKPAADPWGAKKRSGAGFAWGFAWGFDCFLWMFGGFYMVFDGFHMVFGAP